MPNYFTHFGVGVPLKDATQVQYALELAAKAVALRYEEDPAVPPEFPPDLVDVLEEWRFETEEDDTGIWLRSDDGGVDAACAFIQHLLRRFDQQGCVKFQWSCDSFPPCVDAYRGGAAFITAREIRTMRTGDWLDEQHA